MPIMNMAIVAIKDIFAKMNLSTAGSIAVAAFCMLMVFLVLSCICIIIKCFSLAVVKLEHKFGKKRANYR